MTDRRKSHARVLFGILVGFWLGVALSYAPRLPWG